MKFYNKEFWKMASNHIFVNGFEPIEDKEYSDEDIKNLYNQRLQKEMEIEKIKYNTKPEFSKEVEAEILNDDNIDFTDYLVVNESGEIHIPKSKKEIIDNMKKEYQKKLEQFNTRVEFDDEAFENEFKENYEFTLEDAILEENLPQWVASKVDNRIIALSYLPKSILERAEKEQKENEKKLDEIRKNAEKELSKQHIPSKIKDRFNFYESRVRAFKQVKDSIDYEMRIVTEEDEVISVVFKNAVIVENEKMDFRKNVIIYEADELYKIEEGYEVHMMLNNYAEEDGLKYITLKCEDIKITKKK